MKVERLDHIHIFVKDIKKAKGLFSRILGTNFSLTIVEENLKLQFALSPLGIELIEPTSRDSGVAKTLERRGEGLAGISFKVANIEQAITELQSQGLRLVGKSETGSVKEAQFHPADACGVMLELCQYEEQHSAALPALGKGLEDIKGSKLKGE